VPTKRKRLRIAIALSGIAILICPPLLPWLRLHFFMPLLVISFYCQRYHKSLVTATICGAVMDLLAAGGTLGLHALSYCVSAWLLYPQKRHFFEDKFSTLPLMTLILSVLNTLIHGVLLAVFDQAIPFTLPWIATDLLLLPLADTAYAALWQVSFLLLQTRERRNHVGSTSP